MIHSSILRSLIFCGLLWLPGLCFSQRDELISERPNSMIALDVTPKPINLNQIVRRIGYPAAAKEREIEGEVIVQVLMDTSGTYLKHTVVQNPNDLLTQAVETHIQALRCTQAILHGEPTRVWLTIPFNFKLIADGVPIDLDTLTTVFPTPDEFVLVEEPAVPINLTEFKMALGYPEEAKRTEVSGKVVLKVLVNERGNYVKHIVLKDPSPALTTSVEAAIPKLRYAPAIQGGKAVPYWITLPFDFVMVK